MADDKNEKYGSTPTLSQVKVGDKKYYLKDKDARDAIDQEILDRAEADLLKVDKTQTIAGVDLQDNITAAELRTGLNVSDGANKVEVVEKSGNISIDGVSKQVIPDNVVTDANYKHITVTETSVSDGTNTFNKYDDTALAGRVTAAESAISSEETRAKGAESGLDTRVKALESKGRYLSTWNASTGKPDTYPQISQLVEGKYNYRAGDYYIVNKVAAENNLMPDGAYISYDSGTSTWTVPTKAYSGGTLNLGDQFQYDGTNWTYIASATTVAFKNIQGDAMDNDNLAAKLNAKVDVESGKSLVEDTKVASYDSHITNNDIHVTAAQKLEWSGKQDALSETQLAAVNSGINAEKVTKLDGIAAGAQVNVIETVKVDNVALEVSNKAVNIDLSGKVDKEDGKGLSTNDYSNADKNKLAGIESGAEVNKIASIKLNGATLTITDKQVDLGNIAVLDNTVTDVKYVGDSHKLQQKKGSGEYADIHSFGDLADKNIANIQAKGQTVSGVTASYTPAGSVTVSHTATNIESSGSVVAAGTISKPNINLTSSEKDFVTGLKGGSVASFTEGTFTPNTPTALDLSKFNGGSAATFTEGAFTPAAIQDGFYTAGSDASLSAGAQASLTNQTKNKFVKKALNMTVGSGEEAECLIISEVANTDTSFYDDAVTDRGTFTANTLQTLTGGKAAVIDTTKFSGGSKAADTFVANTVASLGTGFYTAGSAASKEADSFTANTLQDVNTDKVNNVTAAALAAAPEFTGSSVNITVNGSYDKANASAVFTGSAGVANVGNIVVAAADIEDKAS